MAGYSFTVAPGERCALCEVQPAVEAYRLGATNVTLPVCGACEEHAIEVQRHLPTARVEVFTAEGALVGHVAPVDEAAPSTSPAPEVPHPYGEGLW